MQLNNQPVFEDSAQKKWSVQHLSSGNEVNPEKSMDLDSASNSVNHGSQELLKNDEQSSHSPAQQLAQKKYEQRPFQLTVQEALQLAGFMYLENRYEDSEQVLLSQINSGVQDTNIFMNLAILQSVQGNFDRCEQCCQAALQVDPGNHAAADLLAHQLLRRGQWADGFRLFESRFIKPDCIPNLMTTYPRWDGTLKHGRRVLIWGEQGLGDTVQFSRLIAYTAERGIEPVLLVQDELVELFQQSQLAKEIYPFSQMIQMQKNQFGQDIFVPRPGILKELKIDAHLPIMSLAHVLNFNPEKMNFEKGNLSQGAASISNGVYLHVSEQKKKAAAAYLESLNLSQAPRIGIVWSGSWSEHPEYQKTSNRRRIPLAKMAPILQNENFNFFCFQKGFDEIARLEFPQIRPLPLTNSYADTAALLLQMDLLITIDTSICHVAGGLGVPVWLMNRYDTCWRWLTGEGSSIWYPSLEIFKQNSSGDWDSVIAKINQKLKQIVSENLNKNLQNSDVSQRHLSMHGDVHV